MCGIATQRRAAPVVPRLSHLGHGCATRAKLAGDLVQKAYGGGVFDSAFRLVMIVTGLVGQLIATSLPSCRARGLTRFTTLAARDAAGGGAPAQPIFVVRTPGIEPGRGCPRGILSP